MSTLFFLLTLASLVLLLVGLAKPGAVVRWSDNKTRKSALRVYGLATLVLFILFVVTLPDQPPTETQPIAEPQATQKAPEVEQQATQPKPEPQETQPETSAIEEATEEVAGEQEYVEKMQNLTEQGWTILYGVQTSAGRQTGVTQAIYDYQDGTVTLERLNEIVDRASDDMLAVSYEVVSTSPPPRFKEAHQHISKGLALYDSALVELSVFFKDGSTSRIDKYLKWTGQGAQEISLGTKEFK